MAIPSQDVLLVPFSTNWNTRLTTDAAQFGFADTVPTAYRALHNPYVAAYTAMMNARADGTRSKSLTDAKNSAKKALLSYARYLYDQLQSNPAVADDLKTLLGVVIPSKNYRPTPPITVRPATTFEQMIGNTARMSIFDPTTKSKRGRAAGATQAFVYWYAGASYPSDPTKWNFAGPAKKYTFETTLPDSVASGTQVWFCAAWVNNRGEAGPVSVPVSAYVQYGLGEAA
jgi:hypothetical protein